MDFFLKLISLLVQLLLWLGVVLSPVLAGGIVAFFICDYLDELNLYVIYSCLGVGLIFGVAWAEHVRRNIGLSYFFGRLTAHREIDGPGKPYK